MGSNANLREHVRKADEANTKQRVVSVKNEEAAANAVAKRVLADDKERVARTTLWATIDERLEAYEAAFVAMRTSRKATEAAADAAEALTDALEASMQAHAALVEANKNDTVMSDE